MILRKRKIGTDKEEINFTVSFTASDVWRWGNRYAKMWRADTPEHHAEVLSMTFYPADIEYYLLHSGDILGWLPRKHAEEIAAWVIASAIRHGYFKATKTKSGATQLQMTEKITKKNGRPTDED